MEKIGFTFESSLHGRVTTSGYLLENGLVVHRAGARVANPCWIVSMRTGERIPDQPVMGTRRQAVTFALSLSHAHA